MTEKKYLKEEYHRGKWQALLVEKKGVEIQAYAKITEEQAERLNAYKEEYRVRYVLEKEDDELEDLKAKYIEKFNKNPHHLWKAETIKEKLEEN